MSLLFKHKIKNRIWLLPTTTHYRNAHDILLSMTQWHCPVLKSFKNSFRCFSHPITNTKDILKEHKMRKYFDLNKINNSGIVCVSTGGKASLFCPTFQDCYAFVKWQILTGNRDKKEERRGIIEEFTCINNLAKGKNMLYQFSMLPMIYSWSDIILKIRLTGCCLHWFQIKREEVTVKLTLRIVSSISSKVLCRRTRAFSLTLSTVMRRVISERRRLTSTSSCFKVSTSLWKCMQKEILLF